MARRANGEGSIYKLPSGKWRVQVEIPATGGRSRRRLIRHCGTKIEAVAKKEELLRLAAGVQPENNSINELLDAWLASGKEWAPSTKAQRTTALDRHIRPQLGEIEASKAKPIELAQFFDKMTCGPRIKQVAYDCLNWAFRYGVDMELLIRNPLGKVSRPKSKRKKINPFEAVEAGRIMTETADTRWHAFFVLSLACGPRQGELYGLEWAKLDLAAKTMLIDTQATDTGGKIDIRDPKTEAGTRLVSLPEIAVEALNKHRALQASEGLADSPLVFPAPRGKHMDKGRFRNRVWNPLLVRLGIGHRGAHHLRHTYATLALGAGVAPHIVSQILGHSRVSTTLDLYATALPSQSKEASAVMQRLFG